MTRLRVIPSAHCGDQERFYDLDAEVGLPSQDASCQTHRVSGGSITVDHIELRSCNLR